MRPLAPVLIDESHRQAWTTRPELAALMNPVKSRRRLLPIGRPAPGAPASGLAISVHASGPIDDEALAGIDALVCRTPRTTPGRTPRGRQPSTVGRRARHDRALRPRRRRTRGAGRDEQPSTAYGNNFADLTARFGIVIDTNTAQDPTTATRTCDLGLARPSFAVQRHDSNRGRCPRPASTGPGVSTVPRRRSRVLEAVPEPRFGGSSIRRPRDDRDDDRRAGRRSLPTRTFPATTRISDLDHGPTVAQPDEHGRPGQVRAAARARARRLTWAPADDDWLTLQQPVRGHSRDAVGRRIHRSHQPRPDGGSRARSTSSSRPWLRCPRFSHQADHLARHRHLQSWAAVISPSRTSWTR